jgi:hypothetical protein
MSADTQPGLGPIAITLLKKLRGEGGIPCVSPMCEDCGISCVLYTDLKKRVVTFFPEEKTLSTRYPCLAEGASHFEKTEKIKKEIEYLLGELGKTGPPIKLPVLREDFASRLEQFERIQKERQIEKGSD